jgi:hypothetical protein
VREPGEERAGVRSTAKHEGEFKKSAPSGQELPMVDLHFFLNLLHASHAALPM